MSTIDYKIEAASREPDGVADASRPSEVDHLRPLPRISVHAFCETEALQRVMERCGQDRRMSKVTFRVNSGSIAAAANMFSTTPTPNLIIIETSTEPRLLMQELAPLAAVCDPSTKVIIIGLYNDIPLYRDLIRNGISEYIVSPVAMSDVLSAIAQIFVDPDAEPLGRSIAFIGAKAASVHRRLRIIAPGVSPTCFPPKWCWPISTCLWHRQYQF